MTHKVPFSKKKRKSSEIFGQNISLYVIAVILTMITMMFFQHTTPLMSFYCKKI